MSRSQSPFWVSLAALLAAWELYVRVSGVSPLFLVPPSRVAARIAQWLATGRLLADIGATLGLVAAGLGLAAALAVPLGLAVGLWRRLEHVLGPYLILAYATPAVVAVPLLLMWFGFTAVTRLLIVALFAFLPIALNVWWGVRSVDPSWVRAAQVFCANGREMLRQVLLPGSLGSVLAGIRVGGGLALIGAFVAEMYGARNGLGYLAVNRGQEMDMAGVLAGLILLGLLGVGLEWGLRTAERRLAPWRHAQ